MQTNLWAKWSGKVLYEKKEWPVEAHSFKQLTTFSRDVKFMKTLSVKKQAKVNILLNVYISFPFYSYWCCGMSAIFYTYYFSYHSFNKKTESSPATHLTDFAPLVDKPSVMPSNSHKIKKAPTCKQACSWHFFILWLLSVHFLLKLDFGNYILYLIKFYTAIFRIIILDILCILHRFETFCKHFATTLCL